MTQTTLGLDIGGTGIKGALVDLSTGTFVSERHRITTPQPATPQAIAETIQKIVAHFNYKGKIGCGFPSALINGVAQTANNIHPSWIGQNVAQLFSDFLGMPTSLINDADAAGLAEAHYGAAKGVKGTVLLLTIGTGMGSAIINDGRLVRNVELGSVYMSGQVQIAEKYISNKVRKEEELDWEAFGQRLDQYICYINTLLYPERIVLGGGVSKKINHYIDFLSLKDKIVPATLKNHAGIIGAALSAVQ